MPAYARMADVYGPSGGPTLEQTELNAQVSTSQSVSSSAGPNLQSVHLFGNVTVNPLIGGACVVGAIVVVKLLREWNADEGETKDVKAGLYSWVIVTLMAAAGLPILKALLAKFHIPGVSEYVQNA